MKISELKPGNVYNLKFTIMSLGPIKENVPGTKVRDGVIQDETGNVKISLWNDETEKFYIEDKMIMQIGWCKEYEGHLQISTGKFGKMKHDKGD